MFSAIMDLLGSIMGKMEKRSKRPEPTKQQKDLIERNKKLVEREREKKKFMKKKIEVIFFEFINVVFCCRC